VESRPRHQLQTLGASAGLFDFGYRFSCFFVTRYVDFPAAGASSRLPMVQKSGRTGNVLMRQTVWVAAIAATMFASAHASAQASPAELYGDLFRAVQLDHVFPDGKSFADAVPREPPAAIMADYARERPRDPATLRAFVLARFVVPDINDHGPTDMRAHIRALWPLLTRQPVSATPGGSALAIPAPFVVPGGRFREIYYWDSYFTMLGLAADGQQSTVESMIADFTDAIELYGHIPNGLRTYYLSRSQPPFYAMMLDLSQDRSPSLAAKRLAALKREHDFWMQGSHCLGRTNACLRVVRMPDGSLLNRYRDDIDAPRDESFAEDVSAAARAKGRSVSEVQRDLRSAAESGWDFSTRWLRDPARLETIHTTDIVPVDLNSLLFTMEQRIAERSRMAGDKAGANSFSKLAAHRHAAMDRWLWQADQGRYADFDRAAGTATSVVSAATMFPLFVGAASPAQAAAVARLTTRVLLAPGGLRTTTIRTGQQWDAPNGWAPLQWAAIDGLARYHENALARSIAARWLHTISTTYAQTGRMLEKYDIEESTPGGGGEYPTQDGFGWTNGVASAMLQRYPELAVAPGIHSR
jgi:alpha,alpha-trehalase